MFIKKVQREYLTKFGEDLIIDFPAMKETIATDCDPVKRAMLKRLAHYADLEGLSLDQLRRKDISMNSPKYQREKRVIMAFVRDVKEMKWNHSFAATLLDRNRTIISYYIRQITNETETISLPGIGMS